MTDHSSKIAWGVRCSKIVSCYLCSKACLCLCCNCCAKIVFGISSCANLLSYVLMIVWLQNSAGLIPWLSINPIKTKSTRNHLFTNQLTTPDLCWCIANLSINNQFQPTSICQCLCGLQLSHNQLIDKLVNTLSCVKICNWHHGSTPRIGLLTTWQYFYGSWSKLTGDSSIVGVG